MSELDREDFRLWLAAKEPDEVVGVMQDPFSCGLATYLRARGMDTASVCVGWWQPSEGQTERRLPEWATTWEYRALRFADTDPEHRGEITAKHALTILDGLDHA